MEMFILLIPLVTSILFWLFHQKKGLHIVNIAGSALLLLLAVGTTGRFIALGQDSFVFFFDLLLF